MVVRVCHDLRQVVVVCHADRLVVRVGLAQIGLGVVRQIVTVLVPVELVDVRQVVNTVQVVLGIADGLEELPSTTGDLVGTRGDNRLAETQLRTGQDGLRLLDVLDKRNTALEVDVDVHHMAFADGCDVTLRVGLLVVVLIDDGDDLLLREVVDVALAADVKRRDLGGRDAMDGEVALQVDKGAIRIGIDDFTDRDIVTIIFRVVLTAEIEGLIFIVFIKCNLLDVTLLIAQAIVSIFVDGLTDGVRRVTHLEGFFHDVHGRLVFDDESSVVALLVRNLLKLLTVEFVAVCNCSRRG